MQAGQSSEVPTSNYLQSWGGDQERQRPALPSTSTTLPPAAQSHYELEFEKPSSTWARRLFTDAERMSRNELEIARNGKGACSHNITQTRSLSSHSPESSYQPPESTTAAATAPNLLQLQASTLGIYTSKSIQTSPEREKRKSREEESVLRRVPEDGGVMDFHPTSTSQNSNLQGHDQEDNEYDRLSRGDTPAIGSTPHYHGGQSLTMDDGDEEEEEQWILDEELARQGLYRGSYRQLIGMYSLTTAFTLLVFLGLAYLPKLAYPLPIDTVPGAPYHYSPLLPFPLPETLTATAFWALSHLLNSSIFSFFSSVLSGYPMISFSLSSLFQSSLGLILREAVVPILLIPRNVVYDHPTWRDVSFRRTWWIALGWAAAEAIVGIKQGYEGITLYRDVLVSVRRVVSTSGRAQKRKDVPRSGYGSVSRENSRIRDAPDRIVSNSRDPVDIERRPLLERPLSIASSIAARSDAQLKDAIEEEVERDVDELIALRGRGELEDLYGMPFIDIPVFISCLHRVNSVLFVLGSTLLLTAAYIRSSLSLSPPEHIGHTGNVSTLHQHWTRPHAGTQLLVTLPLLVVVQWVLSLLHTPRILPRIGVQTFVYVGFMISLGVFFAGLGVWEGIV